VLPGLIGIESEDHDLFAKKPLASGKGGIAPLKLFSLLILIFLRTGKIQYNHDGETCQGLGGLRPPRRIVFSFDAIHPRPEGRGFLATER
jgi:hypothetical protein